MPAESDTSAPLLTRRRLLTGAAAAAGAGLVLALWRADPEARPLAGRQDTLEPNAYLQISPDGAIVLQVDKVEMGQGVMTGFVTLLAEELRVRPDQVTPQPAPVHPLFQTPTQVTGESNSMRTRWQRLRETGAAAREMLRQAAADRWQVDLPEVSAPGDGTLLNALTGDRLGYGEVAAAAARLPVPRSPALRAPADYAWIGRDVARPDIPDKVRGRTVYGSDLRLPDLRTAIVLRPPRAGDRLGSWDAGEALAAPGVEQVFEIPAGLALVGRGLWWLREAAARVRVNWRPGPLAGFDLERLRADHAARLDAADGIGAREDGNARDVLDAIPGALAAEYRTPYLAHATMETMNATLRLSADACELWVPSQTPDMARQVVCDLTGLGRDQVTVHTPLIGGGFGRRALTDFVAEAVAIAQRVDRPVQLVWTREDDIRHGYYRSATTHRLRAALDDAGALLAWEHRLVAPLLTQHIMPVGLATVAPEWVPRDWTEGLASAAMGLQRRFVGPFQAWDGATTLPYALPNVRVEVNSWDPPVPAGIWRSVGNSYNAFAVECFVDECARAAGTDPAEFRRRHLAGQPRHLAVLERLVEAGGWGKPAAGRHQGLALHECFGSVVGQLAEISVAADARIRVHRVSCVVDCGTAINPDVVRAQLEGGIIFGLTAALHGEIDFADGVVRQSNFHDYPMLRLAESPAIEVSILESTAPPGGIGEAGTPPIAPAVANAVFAATGQRLRELPLRIAPG